MPHLTTPGGIRRTAPAGTEGRPQGRAEERSEWHIGLGVPGWGHPVLAPAEWAELSRPEAPVHWAVLNVSRGPGACPDPYCLAAAARSHGAGRGVLGYLDMRDGARTFGELVSDAHRYLDWYGVDGFYLARCPGDAASLPETRRVAATLRALCEGGHMVTDHGTHPHRGYAETADQMVTFRGSWAAYRWSQVAEWTADQPPWRFCHLVHGLPRTHLEEALRVARWQGAGTVYFTDRTDRAGSPWTGLPGYWDDIVSRLGPGVSE